MAVFYNMGGQFCGHPYNRSLAMSGSKLGPLIFGTSQMWLSLQLFGILLAGVLIISYIRAPDFWETPLTSSQGPSQNKNQDPTKLADPAYRGGEPEFLQHLLHLAEVVP